MAIYYIYEITPLHTAVAVSASPNLAATTRDLRSLIDLDLYTRCPKTLLDMSCIDSANRLTTENV